MKLPSLIVVALVGILCAGLAAASGESSAKTPSATYLDYLPDGRVALPQNYRDWAFLTSGVDMTYAKGGMAGMAMPQHEFDNIFVEPDALRAFKATGTWPDGTVIAKEDREGQTKGSINKGGQFQNEQVMGLELHVKDTKRFKGGWAFFAFGSNDPARQIATTASCYACHNAHAAVDTTFVQFYPTLIGIARAKKTLSANYLRETKSNK
jgi:hypothetical protein